MQELGKGTYGTVFLATVKGTGITRAVKTIPKEKVTNVERFKSEVDIMKTLDHPNILRLYDSFEDDSNIYLVLEYRRLTQDLRRRRTLRPHHRPQIFR